MINALSNLIGKDSPLSAISLRKKRASQRLSSGKKINSAVDDAAGLAISEKMQAQIRGLRQAERNTIDGISLIQTAEGALENVHRILERIAELAVQGANGIYNSGDRDKIQEEIFQLIEEVDNVSKTTHFNKIPLLDGSLGDGGDKKFYNNLLTVQGVAHKPKKIEAAKWEANFDINDITDGMTLTVNGKVFEFDSNNSCRNAGAVPIDISSGVTATIQMAISDTIMHNITGVNASCNLGSNNMTTLSIEGPSDATVKNGYTFEVSFGSTVPSMGATSSTIKPANPIIGSGSSIKIINIDLKNLVDGATININGTVYEIDDINNIKHMTNNRPIYISDFNDFSKMKDDINKVLVGDFGTSTNVMGLWGKGQILEFRMTYKESVPDADQLLNITFNDSNDVTAKMTVVVDEPAIVEEEVEEVLTRKCDEIDFSKVLDGSVFTINNVKFEFDNNGSLSDSSNVKVSIPEGADEAMKAMAFEKAFAASYLDSDYEISILPSDDGKYKIDISSRKGKTTDGQSITMSYENVGGLMKGKVGLDFQIGPNSGPDNVFHLRINSCDAKYLGISNIDVRVKSKLDSNLESVYNAIDIVSTNRTNLGAAQNTLEYNQHCLSVSAENLLQARSRIEDADMAKEMMNFVKENVLEQAAMGMLKNLMNFSRDTVQQLLQS